MFQVCACGLCRLMTTGMESLCSQELNKVVAKMGDSIQCITESENFLAVCTNKAVIETAFNCYLQQEGPIDDQPLNEYVIFFIFV